MFSPEGFWDTSSYLVSRLPVFVVVLPLAGSLLALAAGKRGERLKDSVVLGVTALTVLLVSALYPLLQQGPVRYTFKLIQGFDFVLKVDHLSFLMALLFTIVWFLVALYGTFYFANTHAKTRLYVFFLSTLGHVLGVVFAGDLFSFFLFFELMTFSSFVLFIHNQTHKTIQAGLVYIFMGVIGGLSLLMGIFFIYHSLGTLEMAPMMQDLLKAGVNVPLIVFFFLVGFGIKMGMVPLHIWMAKLYEASPSPVSALSSAVMIKVGAYGLIRVLLLLTTSAGPPLTGETVVKVLGLAVIWLGIITMLTGAVMALLQEHSHRILACSSISQMGYVLLGIGAAAYLGVNGAMGYAGAVFHMINHAAIKAGLFLMIGTIYIHTGQLNTSLIRGVGKRMPYLMVVFVLAALGIGGVPGFNGYISKTLLHHAVVKAYELHSLPNLWLAEKLFVLTSALTVCYFLKFFLALFSGETLKEHTVVYKTPLLIKALLAVFGLSFVFIGIFPNIIYEGLILPSLTSFAFNPANVARYLEGINFFETADLTSVAVTLALAVIIYAAGSRFRWFTYTPPRWMSVETVAYVPVVRLVALIACKGGTIFDGKLNYLFDAMGRTTINACKYVSVLDRSLDYSEDDLRRLQAATGESCELDEGRLGRKIPEKKLAGWLKWNPGEFNTKNINFDTLLLAFMLAIFLVVLVYFAAFQ